MMITVVFLILILITYIVVRFIHYFGKYKRIKAEHEEAENFYKLMIDKYKENEKEEFDADMVVLVPGPNEHYVRKIDYKYVKSMKAHGIEFEKYIELAKYSFYSFSICDGKRFVNVLVERKHDIDEICFLLKRRGLKVIMRLYDCDFFCDVLMMTPYSKQSWYSRLFNESEKKKLSEEIKSVWKTVLENRLLAPNLR